MSRSRRICFTARMETSTPDAPQALRKVPFVESNSLLGDGAALRRRAEEDGYLFFRQLLPRDMLLDLRADLLAVVERHGWRAPGQDRWGGLIDIDAINQVPEEKMRTDIGVSAEAYDDAQKLESLHRAPHHPALVNLFRTLFGREVLVHPRHIARMITPHKCMVPTPPHQDFPLIQGTPETWTCWFPLGDCPRELGGLTMLRGSHRKGYIPIQPARGAGNLAVQLCPTEVEWAEGDYRIGDAIVFPSYTVHKALRCQLKGQIRLSLDVRYQPVDQPVEERSLHPHCDLKWEQVYRGWKSAELQYYWRKLPLQLIPWDDGYIQPQRRIC